MHFKKENYLKNVVHITDFLLIPELKKYPFEI